MTAAANIIARIRANGANVMLDGDKLHIVNKLKLPAGALDFIKANGQSIASHLAKEADHEERIAIMTIDSPLTRKEAEFLLRWQMTKTPEGYTDERWQHAVNAAAIQIDRMGA